MTRCDTCKYWERHHAQFSSVVDKGTCRRHAPRAALILDTEASVLDATWPETHDDEWCGEWEAATISLPVVS